MQILNSFKYNLYVITKVANSEFMALQNFIQLTNKSIQCTLLASQFKLAIYRLLLLALCNEFIPYIPICPLESPTKPLIFFRNLLDGSYKNCQLLILRRSLSILLFKAMENILIYIPGT